MLRTLLGRFDADAAASWMIGDSMGDVEAGRAAGVNTALVFLPNRCELCPLRGGLGSLATPAPDLHGTTLAELARGILRHGSGARATLKSTP
jgi:D-glycero-D-manno-heptose 1,7-bisphosphate phosphatase